MNVDKWEGCTILIVEDDEISLEFLKELFEPYKADLIVAYNGRDAIELCRKENLNLVLMDVQLPVLDGRHAMLEIKSFKPNLPIVAQTAFAMSGDRERYLREGFDAYISKPINVQELLLIVDKHIG